MTQTDSRTNSKSFTDFLVHIHPRSVPQETLRFTLSWGLGGMSTMLVLLLLATGIMQLLMYTPEVSGAYASVQAMYTQIPLGGFVRNIHYWSANLLIIIVMLHLLRVFLTGALGFGRRLNWVIGLVILFLILFANFSGYLLPWDQLAYWAVTICTGMMAYFPGIGMWLMELFRGGPEVGPATLANFYALHIAIIPGFLLLFMIWHFWLVRKSGGLVQAKATSDTPSRRVPTVPHLIMREAAVGLSLVAVLMVFSVFWDAPLLDQANPGMSPNPAKAAWYFLGFQELLLHLHPLFAVCIIPVLAAVLLFLLPFWQGAVLPAGIWFGGNRGRLLSLWAFVTGGLVTFTLVVLDERLLRATESTASTFDLFSRGGLPVSLLALTLVAGYQLLVRKFRFSRAESVMAAVIFMLAVLVACTVTGIWFRGPGMQLVWPWQ